MKPNDIAYYHYLRDLVTLLIEDAKTKKDAKVNNSKGDSSDKAFALGNSMGYYEVISLMQSQADHFRIPRENIGLDKINPDQELL